MSAVSPQLHTNRVVSTGVSQPTTSFPTIRNEQRGKSHNRPRIPICVKSAGINLDIDSDTSHLQIARRHAVDTENSSLPVNTT